MIIGFAGLARSGKNESAKALESVGFSSIAFADKLKEFLWQVNPYMRNYIDNSYSPLQDIFEQYGGWEGLKDSPYKNCYRQLMQNIGTEAGRGVLGKNTWIDALNSRIRADKDYSVTDVRFPNENEYIKSKGGVTILVERPGLTKVNEHASEQLNFETDYVIINNGSKADLHKNVLDIYERLNNVD